MAGRRVSRAHGDRREELIEAAAQVVDREGVAAATTRKIAAEAGVPLGTVHYWFATKDELLEALALDHIAKVRTAASAALAVPGQDPRKAAEGSLRAALEREQSFSAGQQLVLFELTVWALRTPGRAGLAGRLYAAIREASVQVCAPWFAEHGTGLDADAATFGAMMGAFFDGLSLARLADPEGTDTDGIVTLLATLLGAAGRSR